MIGLILTTLCLLALLAAGSVICAGIGQRRHSAAAKPCEHDRIETARERDGDQTLIFYRCSQCATPSTELHRGKPPAKFCLK